MTRTGVLLIPLMAVAGCAGHSSFESSGAPPTVICGTTLSTGAAGANVYDATKQTPTITAPTVGGLIFIRVSDDCAHGAVVSWAPADQAELAKQAKAADGRSAAVVLRPVTPTARFILKATRDGKITATATVRLAG